MLLQYSLVLLIVPLARLSEFVNLLINSAGIIIADDLTEFIHFFNSLH